jgi:hypothetical protein
VSCARTLILLAAIATVCQAQFEAGFQDRAMAHIRYLAGLSNRIAGSEGDTKAIRYIQEQFERLGLTVSVEPFVFRSFNLEKAVVTAGDQKADVERIVFDPYAGITRLRGPVAFIVPEAVSEWAMFSKLDLKDKLVVTRGSASAYRLASKQPQALVFVSEPDFERLRTPNPTAATIEITGKETRVRSANVVATLSPKGKGGREAILSAHLDSVRVPGADDNASGVAVLLELARYYSNLKNRLAFRLKFVALGAEEVGMLGAKAYLGTHLGELKDCALVFNMDSIGGNDKMYVEMRDGIRGIAGKAVNQLPEDLMDKALNDVEAKWMYLPSGVAWASNVPEWLQTALKSTAKDLGFEFVPSREMGSDHAFFAQAGIVATNIAISGLKTHSPEDIPEKITPISLERAARLVAGVMEKLPASDYKQDVR